MHWECPQPHRPLSPPPAPTMLSSHASPGLHGKGRGAYDPMPPPLCPAHPLMVWLAHHTYTHKTHTHRNIAFAFVLGGLLTPGLILVGNILNLCLRFVSAACFFWHARKAKALHCPIGSRKSAPLAIPVVFAASGECHQQTAEGAGRPRAAGGWDRIRRKAGNEGRTERVGQVVG